MSLLLRFALLASVCWGTATAETTTATTTTSSSRSSTSRNPYLSGCLREKVPNFTKRRVCNSQDDDPKNEFCDEPPPLEYLEIRVASGNWDSNTALAWLIQIVLSELLGVPSSNEAGAFGQSRDFYDYDARIDYDSNARATFLEAAADIENGDCQELLTPKTTEETYVPCAHFIPEFWGASASAQMELVDQGKLEPPQSVGLLGQESWFVTKFTAEQDATLDSYHGLAGEQNRRKLAEAFKRPTTWEDYCEQVSEDNCTTADDTAKRYPSEEGEGTRMFVPDLYKGYFRYTEKNNCTLWPTNCTGHVANYPCGWSSRMESSIYHLNMALDPNNGPGGSPSGYSTSQLKEMWYAANATRSNLMMMWWTPEPLYQEFLETDAEMEHVMLKPYTKACADASLSYIDEDCDQNLTTRVGPPEAACANPVEPLAKMIAGNLFHVIHSPNNKDIPDAAISPAYDMLRRFQITEVQLGEIFRLWDAEPTPREGVCRWAAENLEFLMSLIPDSYPRVTQERERPIFGDAMIALGSLSTLVTLITAAAVHIKRDRPAIQSAQLDFLYLLLSGSFLVGIGSILSSVPASDGSCTSAAWFLHIGYTLELVPLIIKVAAINRMMEAAKALRRVTITRVPLYTAVAVITVVLVAYLTVWTVLDPAQRTTEYTLTEATTDAGDRVVAILHYCSSDSLAWEYVAAGWNLVLLLGATVLAYQTRNILKTYNESRVLGVLIYSHFLFVVLRCCTFLLTDHLTGTTLGHIRTLLYASDQIAACFIYFVPKLVTILQEEPPRNSFSAVYGSGLNKSSQSAPFQNSGEIYHSGPMQGPGVSNSRRHLEQAEYAPDKPSPASVTFAAPSPDSDSKEIFDSKEIVDLPLEDITVKETGAFPEDDDKA